MTEKNNLLCFEQYDNDASIYLKLLISKHTNTHVCTASFVQQIYLEECIICLAFASVKSEGLDMQLQPYSSEGKRNCNIYLYRKRDPLKNIL